MSFVSNPYPRFLPQAVQSAGHTSRRNIRCKSHCQPWLHPSWFPSFPLPQGFPLSRSQFVGTLCFSTRLIDPFILPPSSVSVGSDACETPLPKRCMSVSSSSKL
ncbi:hypothetical protein BDV25DRAFT_8315 [Aspergillus avenaceus]|uniref:Uncharacterized protein n=1 Tax=Aspergillus avenaceus TaxID=36643 RepID=A0A5N6TRI9_ASPAV|nr:hypothetical protein BDV25DRAFT_8315 [Aspergillus avenaceus]